MKVVKAGYEIMRMSGEGLEELKALEEIGRVCYRSKAKAENEEDAADITDRFIRNLIANGHEAMLEHGGMTVLFTCDRGVSHELVRHRMASFAQESTRWCNYSKEKFGGELTFVTPHYLSDDDKEGHDSGCYWWEAAMDQAEESYLEMLNQGYSAQEARAVLPNSLMTRIVVTANWREWRHIFKLRCARDAHPQMKEIMIPLFIEMMRRTPALFQDIGSSVDLGWYREYLGYDHIEVLGPVVMVWDEGDITKGIL